MNKIWDISERKYDDIITQLLYNRGVISRIDQKSEIDKFFEPDFEEDLLAPHLLPDFKKAINRIKEAVSGDEKIGIFADYDADGIPGAALLYKTLRLFHQKIEVYIPNRESGYGLNREGIDVLAKSGCSLIITVDLGIRNFKEALYCQSKKIDLVITDHHLPGDKLPKALAIVNPMRKGSRYPFANLAGAGVAFKIVQGLAEIYPQKITESFLKWNLDLVAISTIADVVPLLGENRTIAKYGLIVINKTKNIGLSELCCVADIKLGNLSAYSIAFQIAPRINAPGRIDHATKSFQLLITEDRVEAKELAKWLNDKNIERQKAMDQAIAEATKKIERENLDQSHIISVVGDWTKGILGPSASKIVEKFYRPTVLFSSRGETYSGSARSIEGVNIVDIFENLGDQLIRFGGHKGAAGLSVLKSKYRVFEKKLIDYCAKKIDPKLLVKKIKIDTEIKPKELKLGLYDNVIQFEPFGMGNPKPVFIVQNVTMEYPRFVGKEGKHLSAQLVFGSHRFKAIYFNYQENRDIIKHKSICDAAFTLSDDTWNDERKLCLNIIDLKHHV